MTSQSVLLRPKVAWPRRLSAGQRYLVTVELEHSNIEDWPYDDEEYPITCVLAGDPDMEIRAVGSPIAMLHRFGGSYEPVRFLISTPHENRRAERSLVLTLVSAGGVPIRSDGLPIRTEAQDSEPSEGTDTTAVWLDDGVQEQTRLLMPPAEQDPDPEIGLDPKSVVRLRVAAASRRHDRELDLSGLGLSALPDDLRLPSWLTGLRLDGNRLTAFPDAIENLTDLVSLNLSRNQLTSIPYAIGRLTQLRVLDLGHNRLGFIPQTIGRLNELTSLDLSYNQLTSIPHAVRWLSRLASLDLNGNPLIKYPSADRGAFAESGFLPYGSARPVTRPSPMAQVKIVIGGGFGVGKTTALAAVSEIMPLSTEATMTGVPVGVDDLSHVPHKTTTTVGIEFGRLTLAEDLQMFLFATSGTERFWFLWDELALGAICALVLVDTRRLADSFAPIDYFESIGLPFVVAVNVFDGVLAHPLADVREALEVDPQVPVVSFDARDAASVIDCLKIALDLAVGVATNAVE